MLEKILKKSAASNVIISAIFVLIGILLLYRPEAMQTTISVILGIIAIVAGVLKLINYAADPLKDGFTLSTGIILVITGFVIIFFGERLQELIKLVIAIWIIYSSIMDLITIFKWSTFRNGAWYVSLLIALIMLIAGIWLLFISTANLFKLLGIIILVYGILDIIENIIFMVNLEKDLK